MKIQVEQVSKHAGKWNNIIIAFYRTYIPLA